MRRLRKRRLIATHVTNLKENKSPGPVLISHATGGSSCRHCGLHQWPNDTVDKTRLSI